MFLDRMALITLEIRQEHINTLTPEEQKALVKSQYKKLALQFHPDKWSKESKLTQEEMNEKFKELTHAYQVITNPSYRASIKKKDGQVSLNAVFNINLTFEDAYFGSETCITFNPSYVDSTGKTVPLDVKKPVYMDAEVVSVIIPPKTKNGDNLVITGRGLKRGDERGDMVFVFSVSGGKFRLDSEDDDTFRGTEKVPLEVMLTGGKIEVETIWGLKTVSIPAGSKPGETIISAGFGADKKGRYVFEIDMEFPTKEQLKSKTVWQKLGINWKKDTDVELSEEEEKLFSIFESLGGFTPPPPGGKPRPKARNFF